MGKHLIASFHAREAVCCLSVAERISDEFTMHTYRAFAIEHLISAANALGYDLVPGGPSDRPDCLALVQKIIAEIKIREAA